jgi:hypothetical protein
MIMIINIHVAYGKIESWDERMDAIGTAAMGCTLSARQTASLLVGPVHCRSTALGKEENVPLGKTIVRKYMVRNRDWTARVIRICHVRTSVHWEFGRFRSTARSVNGQNQVNNNDSVLML